MPKPTMIEQWRARAEIYKVFLRGQYRGEVAAVNEEEAWQHAHILLFPDRAQDEEYKAARKGGEIRLERRGKLYKSDHV